MKRFLLFMNAFLIMFLFTACSVETNVNNVESIENVSPEDKTYKMLLEAQGITTDSNVPNEYWIFIGKLPSEAPTIELVYAADTKVVYYCKNGRTLQYFKYSDKYENTYIFNEETGKVENFTHKEKE